MSNCPCNNLLKIDCSKASSCYLTQYFKKCEPRIWPLCRDLAIDRFCKLIKYYQSRIRIERRTKQIPDKNLIAYYKCKINDFKTRRDECKTKGKKEKCLFTRTELGCGYPSCAQEKESAYKLFFSQRCNSAGLKYGNTTKQGNYLVGRNFPYKTCNKKKCNTTECSSC